ncbi:NADH:flavin oxidoreductase/NADH oxidase [Actinoplanes sp. NPDC051494]|uniref:NADH:flavin oxidoreductase/NADH oxidase n=1 Tax=Actinoplanes sp. NPDC051494 TaxID=3363907 RepID=UPI0037BC8A01
MPGLFEPVTLRGLTVDNRVWMSPMCTYSASPAPELAGRPTDFHVAHYAARAAGGVGVALVEATGVVPEGRISPFCLGLWSDDQIPAFTRVATAIREGGAVPGIQLAHAGRKGSTGGPFLPAGSVAEADGGWPTAGPSAVAFPGYATPAELTTEQIAALPGAFADAARRAVTAGFEIAEVHAAHGYLLHEFLSPLSNHRTDEYGGSLENRARLILEVIDAVRAAWPAESPLLLRVSMTDWVEENPEDTRASWTVGETAQLVRWATEHGVDLVDCSSGGNDVVSIPSTVDYQTALAARLRAETGAPIAAVGRITEPEQAQQLIESGQADVVLLARALLRDPSWANRAAEALGQKPRYMKQYAYTL